MLVVLVLLCGAASPAAAFTCVGKALGNYCDGKTLVTCAYGEVANEIYCPGGCLAQGSNSKCDDPPCTNFCCGKTLGNYCNGKTLVTCAYDEVANEIYCPGGCVPGGTDVQCADPPCNNFCCGKALGNYCDGKTLVTCAYDEVANEIDCPDGCIAAGGNSQCGDSPCTNFCCGKALGNYCDGKTLVTCAYDEVSNELYCPGGCIPAGSNSTCGEAPCTGYCCGKADGEWCHNNLLWACDDEECTSALPCPNGCEEGDGPGAECFPPPDFCEGLADGDWCDGSDDLVTCQGGQTVESVACPGGCTKTALGSPDFCTVPPGCAVPSVAEGPLGVTVDPDCCPHFTGSLVLDVPAMAQNQEAYQNIKLGTSNKSLYGSGCMVTAFSMFYEHAGFHRTLQGEVLVNNPENENAWRTHNVQGYACCGDMECDPAGTANKCCALWNANPPCFGTLIPVYNAPQAPCMLEVETAADIASVLNSGSTMMGWVKGESTSQHWVLLVGVDGEGNLLLNDPWGGHKAAPINGDQGPAPYWAIPMLLVREGSGGTEPLGDGGTPKSAALEGHDGPIGVTEFTDKGEAEFLPRGPVGQAPDGDVRAVEGVDAGGEAGGDAGGEAGGAGTGCSVTPGGSRSSWWLLPLALFGLLAGLFRRWSGRRAP